MCLIIHILSIVFLCFTYYFCLSECFCPFLVFLFRFYTIVIYLIITVLWSNGAEYSSVQLLIVSRSDLAHIEHDIWPTLALVSSMGIEPATARQPKVWKLLPNKGIIILN